MQSDDVFMVSKDRTRAYVHCMCGMVGDNITFVFDERALEDGDEGWWVHVAFEPSHGWMSKLRMIWGIINGRDFDNSFILNRQSTLSMRNWLSEYLDAQKSIDPMDKWLSR